AEILRRLDRRSPVLRPDLETPEPAEEAPRLGRWRAAREEDHRGHGGACAAHHALTCSCAGTAPGALGRASTRRGDQRGDTRSTTTKSTGTRKIAMPVENSMPVMVTVPISCRATAPAPSGFQSGVRARM